MKKILIIITVFVLSCTVLFAQGQKVRSQKLADNLYVIKAVGVNSVILFGADRILLVDDNTEGSAQLLWDEIKNISKDKLKYIVNTHWHFDHTEGNMLLGNGVTIISHEDAKTLLSRDEMLLGDLHKAYPEFALPSVTFKDKYSLSLNGETVDIISLSGGHSAGDAIVYFKKADVLHIGDIVFADMFPFVDTDDGGSVITLSENLQSITDMITVNTRVIPGHGRILSSEDIKEYRKMLDSTINIVKKEMEKNKTLEEIKSSKPLEAYSKWQAAFNIDDWIEITYNSLRQKR